MRRRPYVWLLRVVSLLVPARLRSAWRREWEAELAYRDDELRRWSQSHARRQRELMSRSGVAVWDALWLVPLRWEDEMLQDIRYGARIIRRSPLFSSAAAVSLAIGVAASTGVASIVSAVLWRPLPYPHADRIVTIGTNMTSLLTVPAYKSIESGNHVFELVAAVETAEVRAEWSSGTEQLKAQRVSPTFAPLFGLDTTNRPAPGRAFPATAFASDASPTVIISRRVWRDRFNQDPGIVGRTMMLDGQLHEVAGVLPREFSAFPDSDFLVPLRFSPAQLTDRYTRGLQLLGRLKPGVELPGAERQLSTITMAFDPEQEARLTKLADVTVGGFRRTVMTMVGGVSLVLLIACANFANLLLARSGSRQHEVAIRTALGARRLRVVRQLLVESVLLAVIGGVAGVVCAYWLVRYLVLTGPPSIPRLAEIGVDWQIAAFGLGLSLLTGLVFGLMPAIGVATTPLLTFLGHSGTARGSGLALWRHHRGRTIVTVCQFALTLVLLIAAGLFLKSFWQATHLDPGYDARNRLVVRLKLKLGVVAADTNPIARALDELLARLRAIPGIRGAGASSSLPLASAPQSRYFTVEHRLTLPAGPPETLPMGWKPPPPPPMPPASAGALPPYFSAITSDVTGGFFRSLGIPIVRGRDFTEADGMEAVPVAIVNDAMARRYWPDDDAVGKRIRLRPLDPWLTVVGVVGNIRRFARDDAIRSELYRPTAQATAASVEERAKIREMLAYPRAVSIIKVVSNTNVVLVTELPLAQVSGAVRASMPSGVTIEQLTTMQGMLDEAGAPRQFMLLTFAVFAAASFVLAGLGVFGVMHHMVSTGAREMGIRLALGATRSRIFCMVVGRSLALSISGVALGMAALVAISRRINPAMHGVSSSDPLTLSWLAIALVAVAILAALIPARLATRVDPLSSLRDG